MIEIAIEGDNIDVLAGEMKSYLDSVLNLINTIRDELDCENETHRKLSIYVSSELIGLINVFTENIKKVRREVLGISTDTSFH